MQRKHMMLQCFMLFRNTIKRENATLQNLFNAKCNKGSICI